MVDLLGAFRMSSSQRLLFRLFAVAAAVVLSGGRADRSGQRSADADTVSAGGAARALAVHAARTQVSRVQGQLPQNTPGLPSVDWTPVTVALHFSDGALVPIEAPEHVGARPLRRILKMGPDEPPSSTGVTRA